MSYLIIALKKRVRSLETMWYKRNTTHTGHNTFGSQLTRFHLMWFLLNALFGNGPNSCTLHNFCSKSLHIRNQKMRSVRTKCKIELLSILTFFPKETFLKHKFSHMKCVVFHILTKYLSKDLWRVKNRMKIEPKIVFGEHVSNLLTQIKSRSWVSYLYDGWLK